MPGASREHPCVRGERRTRSAAEQGGARCARGPASAQHRFARRGPAARRCVRGFAGRS
jgi:hypothetical protein